MKKIQKIIRLNSIANKLDAYQMTKEADILDRAAAKLASHGDDAWADLEPSDAELEALEREIEESEEEFSSEMTDEELKMELEALRNLLERDELGEGDKSALVEVIQGIKAEIGEPEIALEPSEEIIELPVAEASKKH